MPAKFLSLVLMVLAAATPLLPQADRATVTGTIVDSSGHVVPDGKVTVTYPATGLTRTVTSNGSGAFLLTGLPVGHVLIEVDKTAFRPVRSETDLNVGQTKTLDIPLEISTVDTSVEVVSEPDLSRNSAAIGATFNNTQISQLPINGRNWGGLMTLTPGAIDTGAGNGASVRFFGQGGDDVNYRVDGVDATAVRNQAESKSRLMISEDAIAEFRVTSQLFTAETGGSTSAQVEIVSKGGTNEFHGSLFEYLRNSDLDSRSPFDGRSVPPFKMNQFGATLGGPVLRDKTFFFLSYEGLVQRQYITQIGFVPSDAFRAASVPAVRPLLALYPEGQTPVYNNGVLNSNVRQWMGTGLSSQNEHTGLLRIDHRFSDKLSAYFRASGDTTNIFTPNASLPYGTRNLDAPSSGLFDFLYLVSPNTTNELRIGANYAQPLHSIPNGAEATISIPSLSTIPGGNRRIAFGLTQSLIDQWSTLRGAHNIKAGIEIRRVQLIVHDFNLSDGTAGFANLSAFQTDKLNTLAGSGELPTKQMRKIEYFGYIQDEWKIKPNLTANIGVRYEFFNAFSEIHNRDIPFDVQGCGGYCPAGSPFAYPPTLNLAPRLSLAWAPDRFGGRTVIRVVGGIFFGDAQLGDQYSPANNDAVRYTFTASSTPACPIRLTRSSMPLLPLLPPHAPCPSTMPTKPPSNGASISSRRYAKT